MGVNHKSQEIEIGKTTHRSPCSNIKIKHKGTTEYYNRGKVFE